MSRFVRRTPLAGFEEGREFSLNWGDQSLVREIRVWYGHDGEEGVTAIQVVWVTDDGVMLRSPVLGPAPLNPKGDLLPFAAVITLGDDDVLNGLYGYHGGEVPRVRSIGVVTQDRDLPLLGASSGEYYRLTLADTPGDLMPNGLVTGLCGRYDRSGLRGIGLRVAVDGVGPRLIATGPGGRMVPTADVGKLPRVDADRVPAAPAEHPANRDRLDHVGDPTPEHVRPNPNHVRVDVRRLDQWDDILRLHSPDEVREFRFSGRVFDPRRQAMVDRYDGVDIAAAHFEGDHAWLEVSASGAFTRPALPPPAASDGPTWGNVFSLDHSVDYLAWVLRGLDISRLAPFNLQESPDVLQDEVFRGPRPGSRDFHIATNGKATVVPNGWQFVGDVAGSTNGRTASAFSDEESRQTWATSLGFSEEGDVLGAKVAYRNNSKAHGSLSSASSGKVVSTIVETMELSHTLVVDPATVELADGFRQAVSALKLMPTEEAIAAFIERFGTHFAHAVTYGSKKWEQRHETEASVTAAVSAGSSQNQSVEAGFHSPEGGASASVSWGSDSDSASSTKNGTGLDVSSSGSVGSATEPVPILLEVEDLTHLLSPVFFDDPYVHVDLRRRVEQFLDEFPLGFDYDDTTGELGFEIYPPRTPPGRPLDREGMRLRVEVQDREDEYWLVRGGKRHRIDVSATDHAIVSGTAYIPPVTSEELERIPDSGETATSDGLMIRTDDPLGVISQGPVARQVWWIHEGRRHLVPSEAVVDVLGGWNCVGVAAGSAITNLQAATTPTSVEGKMIRLADADLKADEDHAVWVIHQRQRHRISDDLGIRKRGGWQRVAIVRREVLERFPDSGRQAL